MNGWHRVALAALLGGISTTALAFEADNLNYGGDATVVFDDNQSQAQHERDQVEDRSLQVSAQGGYDFELTQHSMFSAGAFAEFEKMDETDTLDRTTFGARGTYRWQPSSAFSAPLVAFKVSWQDDNYDEKARDSSVLISQLFVTRRFTDRITATAGLQYRNRDSEGLVWDLTDERVFVNVDYSITSALASYLTYSYIQGDVYSSAQGTFCNGTTATDILPLIDAATAIEEDNAYNNTQCGDWLAYRLDAHTQTAVLGLNYGLSHNVSIDLSVLGVTVQATDAADVSYDRRLIRASLLTRF